MAYNIPVGSIGYLTALANQTYQYNSSPVIFLLSLLTPETKNWDRSCFIARLDSTGTWEISGGHVALADKAKEAVSIKGTAVDGKVSYAKQADEAFKVLGENVVGAVASAKRAASATKADIAFRLSLDSDDASYAEATDAGFGNSIIGSTVTTNVVEPGLYLVEVVLKSITGITALRDSTFFFIPEYSDKPAPRTQQILCNGTVVLDAKSVYNGPRSRGDYMFGGVCFTAQALESWSGSIATDLAIKVWQIAGASGKANGPFQNK